MRFLHTICPTLPLQAIRDNVSVIDATRTIVAVHQTDFEGNLAGLTTNGANYNMGLLGSFDFRAGATSSAQYETAFAVASNTDIEIERRTTPKSKRKPSVSASPTENKTKGSRSVNNRAAANKHTK